MTWRVLGIAFAVTVFLAGVLFGIFSGLAVSDAATTRGGPFPWADIGWRLLLAANCATALVLAWNVHAQNQLRSDAWKMSEDLRRQSDFMKEHLVTQALHEELRKKAVKVLEHVLAEEMVRTAPVDRGRPVDLEDVRDFAHRIRLMRKETEKVFAEFEHAHGLAKLYGFTVLDSWREYLKPYQEMQKAYDQADMPNGPTGI